MKKIITLFLTVCMTFGAGTAVLAYSDVEENTKIAEAVSLLTDLEIVNGFEDGTYKPNQTVTRAEAAKLICELLDINTVSPTIAIFNDVPVDHWAAKYIYTAANLGIINGYGDGNYGPEDEITYEQIVKMIVCALGYEPMATSKGGYPTGYLSVASSIGLLKNTADATRGDIAILLANALEIPVMEQISYGSEEQYAPLDGTSGKEYKTLFTMKDIYKATGVVGDLVDTNKINFTITKDSADDEFVKKDPDQQFYIGSSNIADYKYQELDVYIAKEDNDYTVVFIKTLAKTTTLVIVSDDIKSISGNKITYYVDENQSKTKTITVDDEVSIEYNKTNDIYTDIKDFEGKEDIQLTFIENSGDSKYDAIVAIEYYSEKLEAVDSYKEKMTLNGSSINFDFEDDDYTYVLKDLNGNELTLDDFSEDDVVAWYCDTYKDNGKPNPAKATYLEIIKLDNSVVVGTIDAVSKKNDNNIVKIDGVKYEVLDTIWDEDTFSAGSEGTYYIGLTGKIVYYDDTKLNVNYGYILASGTEGTFDKDTVIKMLTKDGIKTYTLKSTVENVSNSLAATAKYEAGRFVEYTVNSKGLISSITVLKPTDFEDAAYNADTEILYNEFIEKDTLFFVLDQDDYDESYVTTMKYLVDEGEYTGYIYSKNKETKVVLITGSNSVYTNLDGFAIVSETSVVNKDGEKVYGISYVQNSIRSIAYFEDSVDAAKFALGTVFVFNADSDDFITDYEIVATVKNNEFVEQTVSGIGKKVDVVTGYIENTSRKTNSKGELITVDDTTYVVTSTANKYTLYNDEIEVEDFLAGDAYYKDEIENEVTAVLLKVVDGIVVDIYTISDRISK